MVQSVNSELKMMWKKSVCELIDIVFRYLPDRLRKTKNLITGRQLVDDIEINVLHACT